MDGATITMSTHNIAISISALSGQLTGFLNSGDAFAVSFTQAAPNQISVGNSSVVPVPAAVWLFGSALGVMGWVRRKSVT